MAGATLQSAAKTQAETCIVFVDAAREQAKLSGRTVHEELEDMMLVRLTEASLKKDRARGAVWGMKQSQDSIQVFIEANQNEQDPQVMLKRLTSLSNNITDAARSVQTGGTDVPE